MKQIALLIQMVKNGNPVEMLTGNQAMSSSIQDAKCVKKKKLTFEKPLEITLQILREELIKTGVLLCKFPQHTFSCGNKNNCLEKPFFKLT